MKAWIRSFNGPLSILAGVWICISGGLGWTVWEYRESFGVVREATDRLERTNDAWFAVLRYQANAALAVSDAPDSGSPLSVARNRADHALASLLESVAEEPVLEAAVSEAIREMEALHGHVDACLHLWQTQGSAENCVLPMSGVRAALERVRSEAELGVLRSSRSLERRTERMLIVFAVTLGVATFSLLIASAALRRLLEKRRLAEAELIAANTELRRLNDELEFRVQGRTRELRDTVELLHASEQRLRLATQAAGVGIFDWDLLSNQVHWNECHERIWGLPIGGFDGTFEGFAQVIHPNDRSRVLEEIQRTREKAEPFKLEYRLQWPDGSIHWVQGSGEYLRSAQGQPCRMVGTVIDVTSRRAGENALRESELRLKALISTIDGIVWEVEASSMRFTFVSAQAERILGFPVSQWYAETDFWTRHMHPEDREWAPAFCSEETRAGRGHRFQYRMIAADGRVVWLHDVVAIIQDEGRPLRLRGIMLDISERKRAEIEHEAMQKKLQETQKLESLGLLAGGIAHDFNNLLTGILGHAGLARYEATASWPGLENLAAIEHAAHRAADLCRQMLAYSGKGKTLVQKVNLNDLIHETLELLKLSVSKKATVRLMLGESLPAIEADVSQMRQVLMNLVINASEALNHGSGTITLASGSLNVTRDYLHRAQISGELPEGLYVFLEVIDDGCGMDPETRSKIFDPFFTTKFTGRGLGLPAVHGIVRSHRGMIVVYSEPGRGTTFKILVPAVAGVAERIELPAPRQAMWRGQGTILLVDDEPSVRSVARRALERIGFQVVEAVDGQDCVGQFSQNPDGYALVLLDLTMPRMDGEEAFRALRNLRPDIRVLLMSGFNKSEAAQRFLGKGLGGFLQKPFEVGQLEEEIRRILG